MKKAYVEQGKAHTALVMDGDEAIAWAEYGTPVELPSSVRDALPTSPTGEAAEVTPDADPGPPAYPSPWRIGCSSGS